MTPQERTPASHLHPWPLGTLVVRLDDEDGPLGLRVVIGHRADGACVCAYVNPPPWIPTPARIAVLEVTALRRVDLRDDEAADLPGESLRAALAPTRRIPRRRKQDE